MAGKEKEISSHIPQGPDDRLGDVERRILGSRQTRQPVGSIAGGLQKEIERTGFDILERSGRVPGGRFDPTTTLMAWGMRDEHTKVQLLHFIDALPKLTNPEVVDHLGEYFPMGDGKLPLEMRVASLAGRAAGWVPLAGPAVVGSTTKSLVKKVAGRFFAGPKPKDVLKAVNSLSKRGLDHTVDVLGEAVLSEREAEDYVRTYARMLDDKALRGRLDNVSVKLSSLYSRFDPMDYEGTKAAVKARLKRIVGKAKDAGVLVNIDMEQYAYRDITLDIFKEMILEDKSLNKNNFGIALQTYLKSSGRDVDDLIEFANKNGRTFAVRLVKGAYWEYETAYAKKLDWQVPVYEEKRMTDANFEEQARKLLESDRINTAFGTHNVRSMAYVIATAGEIEKRTGRRPEFEFQMLQGMGDNFKQALVDIGHKVRVYTPCGELLPGMAYLVRRILENTSNSSFLRQANFEKAEWNTLLKDPREAEARPPAARVEAPKKSVFQLQQAVRYRFMDSAAEAVGKRFEDAADALRRNAARAESITAGGSSSVISCPGEENEYVYMPRGRGVVVADGLSFKDLSEVLAASLATGNRVAVAGNLGPEGRELIRVLRKNGYAGLLDYTAQKTEDIVAGKEIDWVFCRGPSAEKLNRLAADTSKDSGNVKRFISGVSPDLICEFFTTKSICTNTMRRGFAPAAEVSGGLEGFKNQPPADFSDQATRQKMYDALETVRSQLGGDPHPLLIGGSERRPDDSRKLTSTNPANPGQIVGSTYNATAKDADETVEAAREAFSSWSRLPAGERSKYLIKAAEIMAGRRFELAAWMVFEAGKPWREAVADVDEAIDFLNYYPREAMRLEKEDGKSAPGWKRTPNGVCAVVSPWNFPLAILTGMAAGAAASGNTVIMKPASQTPVIAGKLMDVFQEAGVPAGVFNFLPGPGREVGDHLVKHPDVDMIAFTGSEEVGMDIISQAAKVERGGRGQKTVVAEMGGKNAIIVDSSADLDLAVAGVVRSAFGYGGQKCSACSRVIVTRTVYDEFIARLRAAVESVRVGDPSNPGVSLMGPLVDRNAREKVNGYKTTAEEEGLRKLVELSGMPEDGHYVAPTVYVDVPPTSALAQQEIFGPILSVMKANDFDHALKLANGTKYGLTGGVYSRTPSHIQKAKTDFRVGNLYINRHITGAVVDQQPFGGDSHSGTGPKAGGPDYLQRFTHLEPAAENAGAA